MQRHDDDALTRRIRDAQSVADLEAGCRDVAHALGFQHYFYAVRVAHSINAPAHYSMSGFPEGWVRRYDEQKYLAIDPIVAHVLGNDMPVIWDEIDRRDGINRRMLEEAAQFHLCHGMTVPIDGRRGERGLFSVAGVDPLPQDPNARLALTYRLQWFAGHIHRSYARLVISLDDAINDQLRFTRRENECLRWAADGLTTAEIADKLNIRERTVHFHLQNVIDKMQVSGRQHAIARAINLGMLAPPDFSEVRCKDPIPTIAESRPH